MSDQVAVTLLLMVFCGFVPAHDGLFLRSNMCYGML